MTSTASSQRLQTILLALRQRSHVDEGVLFSGADLLEDIAASSWLRFGLGLGPRESVDTLAPAELEHRALEFWAEWPLWWAFRTCAVEVAPKSGARIRFRIDGLHHTEHRAWLKKNFAIVTASRPKNAAPGQLDDGKRNQALEELIRKKGYDYWPSINAPDTTWCETSFAILAISELRALRLAEQFGQRAIFYVNHGVPYLVASRWGKMCKWTGRMRILAVDPLL